jgi:hypothetical protein
LENRNEEVELRNNNDNVIQEVDAQATLTTAYAGKDIQFTTVHQEFNLNLVFFVVLT